jgi:hypothetical protein
MNGFQQLTKILYVNNQQESTNYFIYFSMYSDLLSKTFFAINYSFIFF